MNVFVPYRYVPESTTGARRASLWRYCQQRWIDQGFKPISVDVERPDFNRSACINAAAKLAFVIDDVMVIADADVTVASGDQVHRAASTAKAYQCLAFAHTWRSGIGDPETFCVLKGEIAPEAAKSHEWDERTWSSVWAIHRSLWDRVSGFDERFIGWGGEDVAFKCACATLGRIVWTPGTVVHLWHDRVWDERENNPTYWDNDRLFRRYQAAEGKPDAMRAIIAERA